MAIPRSTIDDRRATTLDALELLRDSNVGTINATTTETAIAIKDLAKYGNFNAVVASPGYTGYVAGVDEWTVSIEVSDQMAGTYVQAGTLTLDGTSDQVLIPLEGTYLGELNADPQYARVVATVTGTPGDLDYHCFLSNKV